MKPSRPVRVTAAITVLTGFAFLLQGLGGPHLLLQAGFIPARFAQEVAFPAVPFWLTPLTATLLHGGVLHLGFNLLMFVYCGKQVESVIGGMRLVILYLIGAYGAALAQFAVNPESTMPMIGASGAISAVIGAYALLFGQGQVRRIGPIPGVVVRALWLAAAWVVLQWGMGFITVGTAMPIASAAHVGGFLTGLLLAYPLLEWRYRYG